MRLTKFHVVAMTLATVLIATPAQAQFGRLKDLAKDKLGMQAKNGVSDAAKGPYGEAKATLAPGVKKTANVTRRSSGTPEADAQPAGGSAVTQSSGIRVVTVKVVGADARSFDSVRAYSPCNKVSDLQILSASQLKLTLDLSTYVNKSKGASTCSLYFRSGGETVYTVTVGITGK